MSREQDAPVTRFHMSGDSADDDRTVLGAEPEAVAQRRFHLDELGRDRVALFLARLHEPDPILEAVQLLERGVHALAPAGEEMKKGVPVVEHPLEEAFFVSVRSRVLLLNLSSPLQ